MAEMELIRVIDLEDEATAPDDGQYLLIDSSGGTKKMKAVKLLQNTARTFDMSTSYTAGEYVLYDGQLYCFTAAHEAGAWTGSDAEAVTVGDVLNKLNTDLSVKTATISSASCPSGDIYTSDLDISSSPSTRLMILGFSISATTNVVPVQIYISNVNTIHVRVRNLISSAQTFTMQIYYC